MFSKILTAWLRYLGLYAPACVRLVVEMDVSGDQVVGYSSQRFDEPEGTHAECALAPSDT